VYSYDSARCRRAINSNFSRGRFRTQDGYKSSHCADTINEESYSPKYTDTFKEATPLFSIQANMIYAFTLFLLILSWIAGSKSSRLLYGGSAERISRKLRKQIVWGLFVTLPAFGIIVVTLFMTISSAPIFWIDRILLYLPLALAPLLAIWLLSMPRLWKLLRETRSLTGAPLSIEIRKQAAHPMIIVPFQMSTLGAAAIFYYLLVSPVQLQLTKAIVPIFIMAAATIVVWYVHEQRWQKVGQPEAAIQFHPWRRALRGLGIF